MPPTESNSNVIHIEGTPEAVELAKKRILELATKLKNQRNIDLIVPTKWHSQVIGQGGQRIRELTSQFPELSINFPQRDSESEIISCVQALPYLTSRGRGFRWFLTLRFCMLFLRQDPRRQTRSGGSRGLVQEDAEAH
jgi:hypothetical protein